jgi:hypothetical protein
MSDQSSITTGEKKETKVMSPSTPSEEKKDDINDDEDFYVDHASTGLQDFRKFTRESLSHLPKMRSSSVAKKINSSVDTANVDNSQKWKRRDEK